MRHFKISVPEKRDLLIYWEIIKFYLRGGFKCDTCDSRSDFQQVHFKSKILGKPFIFENHTSNQCPDCTLGELRVESKHVFTNHGKCDWCDNIKMTANWIRHSNIKSKIIFGSNYWNGHNICQGCMNEAFHNRGDNHSSIIERKNGKLYYCNELGLLIRKKS